MLGFGRRPYARRPRVKPAPPFVPTDRPECFLWLTAGRGVTLVSGAVQTWADQTGSGINPTQATAAQRPTYNAVDSGYNNKPSLSFASANSQWLKATGLSSKNQPFTLYVVGQADEAAAEFILSFGDPALTNLVGLAALTGPATLHVIAQTFGVGSVSSSVQSPGIMCGVVNGASSAIYTTNSQTPDNTGNAGANIITTATIVGSRPDVAGQHLNGKIAAVVCVTGADTPAQRAAMYRYFVGEYAFKGFS